MPKSESIFGRLITAMVTPFDPSGQVDIDQAEKLSQHLVATGTTSIIVTGTTGEGPTLTSQESLNLYSAVKASVGTKAKVIAGTTSYDTAKSIQLSKQAESLGVDGILMTVPYYNKPPQDSLYKHFSVIAEQISIPGILYNVPTRTATNMSAETTIKLSRIQNVVGIKEASGDLQQISKIIELTSDDFLVWSGNDIDTLPILSIGGYGVVSVASHLVGKDISEMIKHFTKGDILLAAQTHRKLQPLIDAIFMVTSPIPLKYMLNYLGCEVGDPRLPLTPANRETQMYLETILSKLNVDRINI